MVSEYQKAIDDVRAALYGVVEGDTAREVDAWLDRLRAGDGRPTFDELLRQAAAELRPEGTDRNEDGSDAGAIENGYVVIESNRNADGSPVVIGPFRFRKQAEAELTDMILNGVRASDLSIESLWRPYAVPGAILRVTAAEEERYNRLMRQAPETRTDEEEAFVEHIGDALVDELDAGGDGVTRVIVIRLSPTRGPIAAVGEEVEPAD